MYVTPSGLTDQRNATPGSLLAQITLTCAPPVLAGWLPPGAARPPERRKEKSILDLRQLGAQVQLSLWQTDGVLLWRETLASRAEAEAMAEQLFGITRDMWQIPDTSGNAPIETLPINAAHTFQVNVTRLSRSGNVAFAIGIVLFSIIMMGGMYGSMMLGEYLELGDGGQTGIVIGGALISMLLALIVGFGLPFWLQITFFGEDDLDTTAHLTLTSDGIHLPPLGHLAWVALNAIDQVNTESGEPEAVMLLSDTWGKLMLRASGSNSNVVLAGELLEALLAFWRPEDERPSIFRLLPIRRWWHEVIHVFGVVAGFASFFALMAAGERGFGVTLLVSAFLGFLVWALVALMPLHFWRLTSANRARAFLLQDNWLIDHKGHTRVDLSRSVVTLVHWRRPAFEMDYLHIKPADHASLRLAAFDTAWNDFVANVRANAGHWREEGNEQSSLPEGITQIRG